MILRMHLSASTPTEMRGDNMRDEREYRLVKKHGMTFVEIRYKGHDWTNWLFKASEKPHKYWIHIPELGVYRCNVSYG